jgi:addiction module HigA family antidote
MSMHNPPHPGEFIVATYMEPFDLSCRFLAAKLDVAASTLNRVLKAQSGVSPEMALTQIYGVRSHMVTNLPGQLSQGATIKAYVQCET